MKVDSSPEAPRPSLKELLTSTLSLSQLYVVCAAVLVLANARLFYGSLKMQTEHVSLWFEQDQFQAIVQGAREGYWSAPLDDVFIHFDFAQATAQGYPFQWISGNGYSSGGTSLLYPFVLALGVLFGSAGLKLMHFAGIVACVCTFAALLGARRLFRNLPEWTALLAPPVLLSVGALNWTLFSGMEVALFLALWALCVVVWDDLLASIDAQNASRLAVLGLGLCCALLVGCRPEAAPLVAYFGFSCGFHLKKTKGLKAALSGVVLIGAPGALVVIAHMVANKVLTGDSAAAGALAKLEMHHPYLTSVQVRESWLFFMKYQFLRLSDYHFSAYPAVGYVLWPLGLLSLFFKSTRRYGVLLWVGIVMWISLVATNGQVRWQNERYTMPAVAWLLLSVALGLSASLAWAAEQGRSLRARFLVVAPLALACGAFVFAQAPRFRDQVWFFGRASRNILEQHVRVGQYLRHPGHRFHRALVSDAGAIPYISGLPAIDLIGLGGYGGLPIAKASRQGVGAAIELMEYVPSRDLPDVMALYPSWWGDFVLWFGRKVTEFPVRGNVICGGAAKVIYSPNWDPILNSGTPFAVDPSERMVDSLDVADILNEKAHEASWDREAQGYVEMKILADPRDRNRDLWDAGRLVSGHMTLQFQLSGFTQKNGALLLRVAPPQPARVQVSAPGAEPLFIDIEPSDHWQEVRVPLTDVRSGQFSLTTLEGDLRIFHVFAVEDSPKAAAKTP